MRDDEYYKYCINCGWNDPDFACTVRQDEVVYQCELYRDKHPEEVEEFEKWVDEFYI